MTIRDRIKALLRPLPTVGEDDEFDPFAGERHDPPPAEEGDDRRVAEDDAEPGAPD
jgi:hypothetical protein